MENLIGKKMYGFRYEHTNNMFYTTEMDRYIGAVGVISRVSEPDNSVKVTFGGEINWFYPLDKVRNYLVQDKPASFDENIDNVIIWAAARGLLSRENSKAQLLKVLEEVGETASALLKGNQEALVDGIGDSFVTLIILARQLGLSPAYCLDRAWKEIKERKGETVDGIFVKN